MTPILLVHIAAGAVAILAGAATVTVRKGDRRHRSLGRVFIAAMLAMSVLGAYLALFVPQRASVAVAGLSLYLVLSGWMTVRREEGRIGLFEYATLAMALTAAAALASWGVEAAHRPRGMLEGGPAVAYFAFAAFAAFGAALDLKVILQGGVSGPARLARHLWRMCLALFFAAAFFFIGQQKVMPLTIRGSPILVVLAVAPLVVMLLWLVRVRLRRAPEPPTVAA